VVIYLLVGHGAVAYRCLMLFSSCDTASLPVRDYTEGLSVPGVYLTSVVVVDKVCIFPDRKWSYCAVAEQLQYGNSLFGNE